MLHIMVVDDEAPIRDWLVYCIQKCEAASSVTSAVNGEEAYRRILEQKPNVVFTDIRMPGMDGLELMSKVRDILPFTVFIILTNYAEFSYAKQAISLGAREYILKSEMRSSDIQRIVAEIAATTAKIRSEKVHDVLQDGVVDLYEMYRNFEQPGATSASRAGKRPFLIAKQFCFQQRFGNRPAVDGNKRMRLFALSRIVAGKIFPMNRLGRQLFARPRFPLNQHRRTGAGIQQNSLPYLFHLW